MAGAIVIDDAMVLAGGTALADWQQAEGYQLEVGESIRMAAVTPHGLHNGFMTLLQLIAAGDPPTVPAVKVRDFPRFRWRGMLLDSSRSFLPPDVIRAYIDRLSELKLNVFHWHIVDDQGWRVESRVWPRLHEVGGTLAAMNTRKQIALDRHGWGRDGRGYYTQDELREIVAFARERHVMIVPEIDVPGHSSAMLAAYPELSCSGKPVPLRDKPGIYLSALCPGKEEVYEFLDKLFEELATIFPAPYLHIGSDEVMAGDWQDYPPHQELMAKFGYTDNAGLQSYFVARVHELLKQRGRTMLAWDEVTDYAPAGSVVQAWRKHDYARAAAEKGREVVVSPVTHCYIDYPQLSFTLKNLYSFEPVPTGLDPSLHHLILGGEVNLWGERVTLDNIDRKAFPRVFAHSEVLWSPAAARDLRSCEGSAGICRRRRNGMAEEELWDNGGDEEAEATDQDASPRLGAVSLGVKPPDTVLPMALKKDVGDLTVALIGLAVDAPDLEEVVKINSREDGGAKTPLMTVIKAMLKRNGNRMKIKELARGAEENWRRPFPTSPYGREEFIFMMTRNSDSLKIEDLEG
jgi:N-acetyl-beta-hexosaminidase